jgi:hypothetical protein
LLTLLHAQPSAQVDLDEVWQPEVQRAVLEKVLQENKELAEQLRQQQKKK